MSGASPTAAGAKPVVDLPDRSACGAVQHRTDARPVAEIVQTRTREPIVLEVSVLRWAITIGLIVGLLALDLGLAAARSHAAGFREAALSSVLFISVAIVFGLVFTAQVGGELGAQYFAGYLVEKSLSVDNLFVFVIIMSTFAVPEIHQQKVLTFGIVLALVLRAIFIALGAALLQLVAFMFLVFGLVLIVTAIQLYRHRDADPDPQDNALVRLARRALPVTDDYDGGRLFTRQNGRRAVTPLFIVLLAIGSSDLLFALDSIPAIFGVTEEAYIVFTANAFALAGPTGPVLPRQGTARPARLPLDRPVAHPGVHRRQARPALGTRD